MIALVKIFSFDFQNLSGTLKLLNVTLFSNLTDSPTNQFLPSIRINKVLSVLRQKGECQNGGNKKTKHAKFSEKRVFLTR